MGHVRQPKITKLTVEGKQVTFLREGTTAMVRCGGTQRSFRVKDRDFLSEGELRETLAGLDTPVLLNIKRDSTDAVRQPGSIGICRTKTGRQMAYMVDEAGKVYNTSIHDTEGQANYRVLVLALVYATWSDHVFLSFYGAGRGA